MRKLNFQSNKLLYIRRGIFLFLIAISAALQHSGILVPSLFSAKAMLIIPALVAVAMFEKSMAGLMFGVFAGALWDFASVRGDGFFSVMLAITGYLICVLLTYFMRNNIYSAVIINTVSCLFINIVYWLWFILGKGYEGAIGVLFNFYLPSALYTALFVFIYYYLVKFIVKLTTKERILKRDFKTE